MNVFKILCISPLKISPKADRLLACAVPSNLRYVKAPLVPTSPLKRLNGISIWHFIIISKCITFIIPQLILRKTNAIVATRCHILKLKCT